MLSKGVASNLDPGSEIKANGPGDGSGSNLEWHRSDGRVLSNGKEIRPPKNSPTRSVLEKKPAPKQRSVLNTGTGDSSAGAPSNTSTGLNIPT
jgi:hypothetical protein